VKFKWELELEELDSRELESGELGPSSIDCKGILMPDRSPRAKNSAHRPSSPCAAPTTYNQKDVESWL